MRPEASGELGAEARMAGGGMTIAEERDAVRALLDAIKRGSFHDPAATSDEAAMGMLVSHYFRHPGPIARAAAFALEDANAHELAGYLFGVAGGRTRGGA
jgi:hypothetical protein